MKPRERQPISNCFRFHARRVDIFRLCAKIPFIRSITESAGYALRFLLSQGMKGIERAEKATAYGLAVAPPRRDSANKDKSCKDDVFPKLYVQSA